MNMINDGGPERIWIESDDGCPYFYPEEELPDVSPPITEYVRADKLEELAAEIEALRAEVDALAKDAERYRWLRTMAREQLLNPKMASSEYPDMRTYWRLPTLICSGPVGGFVEFDAAIDAAIAKDTGEQS